MQEEYREKLERLVESGRLDPKSQEAFESMLQRNQAVLSGPQTRWIDNKDAVIFGNGHQVYEAPTQYDNCSLERTNEGTFIIVDDRHVGEPVTRKEAQVILAWLTKALPDIQNEDERPRPRPQRKEPEPEPEEEVDAFTAALNRRRKQVTKQVDKVNDYGAVEDMRDTNMTIDSTTGEPVEDLPF